MTNKMVYDTDILYDHHMDEASQSKFKEFYSKLFRDYNIETIHDCSIGAGGTTLPLATLGYVVSGSDLSENLLNRAKFNFEKNGFHPNLFLADFRSFGSKIDKKVDCVISTGNSLTHTNLDGFVEFLHSASTALNDKGFLFFDTRNWDRMSEEKPVINAYDFTCLAPNEYCARHMLFNWHDNGSVTFSLATSNYKDGENTKLSVIHTPVYYPLFRKDIEQALLKNGYDIIKYIDIDDAWVRKDLIKEKVGDFNKDFENIQWYGILSRKVS